MKVFPMEIHAVVKTGIPLKIEYKLGESDRSSPSLEKKVKVPREIAFRFFNYL